MRHKPFALLTGRVIGFLTAAFLFNSCLGQGTDQIHGMFSLSFPSTAVCESQVRMVSFRNESDEEVVIEGAAISGGTDPEGNFTLQSVTVGSTTTDSVSGILNDIHVPANTLYSFAITYAPHEENVTHTAFLDIAYRSPQEGIVQVALSGISTAKAPTCPSQDTNSGSGEGDLNGEKTITIEGIAFVSSAIDQPISTDPSNTVEPFQPVDVPITFNGAGDRVTLPQITAEMDFLLPRTKTRPLSDLIQGLTLVTSAARVTGSYLDDGSLTLENVPIHLKEQFEADFVVTLTTEEVELPNNLAIKKVRAAGFSLSEDQKKIFGSKLDSETLELTLVGVSTFTNPSGTGTIAASIGNTAGAVIITARINSASE